MIALKRPKITLWRVIVFIIFVAGIYATYARFLLGFRASTNLSDGMPWGLWVGLGTLCGVGLSAGGFAIAAAVYILGFERYRPVMRAAILISFLGYLTVVIGMLFELGLPWRIWHPIFMWNRRSMLFEVAWCVMLYTTVLTLEFSPAIFEKLPWKKLSMTYLSWHHRILIALVLVGVLLSSLHQSFLGGLYLLAQGKMYPLWYSTYLPTFFYLSAIPAGLALTIMALYLSARSLGARLDVSILSEVSKVIVPLLTIYALSRGLDLLNHGGWAYMWKWQPETAYFWLEIALFIIAPLVLLNIERVRNDPQRLYWTCSLIVMGFVANRLNVSITGLLGTAGTTYVPKWTEMTSTLAIIAAAVLAFRYAVLYLDILPRTAPRQRWLADGGLVANA
ncbi:MAG TPA: NrfD/PsrC family molybdoenzyme membrane anchor subunit [Terriglobales bacterium]|nr:NrfD/PsrC family molybdoenzyme membrane anchor subunit [Terriglobales bacterium]